MAKKYPEVFDYEDKSSAKLSAKEDGHVSQMDVLVALIGVNLGVTFFIALKVIVGM